MFPLPSLPIAVVFRRPIWRPALTVAAALLLSGGLVAAADAPPAVEYDRVAQWPSPERPLNEVVGTSGLAVAADGRVFLSDSTANRVTLMAADGSWVREFGNRGDGPDRLGNPGRLEVDNAAQQLYVADTDSYRVVVFDLDGNYLQAWPNVYAAGLSVAPDGRLWLVDVLTSQVRVFDSVGRQTFAFGQRGSGQGRFRQLTDVAVSPSGEVYVGDRNGNRIQVFRQAGETLTLLRTLDLSDAKYRQQVGGGGGAPPGGFRGPRERRCSSQDLIVIDDDTLIAFPCLIKNGQVTFLRGPGASAGLQGILSPYVNTANNQFYAIGIYNPDRTNSRSVTSPAIVQFADSTFAAMTKYWLLAPFDMNGFRSPQRIDVHPNGTVYITDFRLLRRYSADGAPLNTLPVTTYPTDPLSITLTSAMGDGTPDGVIGYGRCLNAGSANAFEQPCVGYFKIVTRQYLTYTIEVLDPVWHSSSIETSKVTGFHYDPVNDMFLVINNDDQQLVSYARLGMGRKKEWALGGTDKTAYFADVGSGPDGKIYVMDVLRDLILVMGTDGRIQRTLVSPSDAWRIAGAPDGRILVLTAFGEVVRLDPNGREEGRFDAKPNQNAQARNLTDLSAAPDGRVYVSDRQASLVGVFAPTGLPPTRVLAGKTCLVQGDKRPASPSINLGDTVEINLSLTGTCGSVEEPTNILLLVNTKNANALMAARQIASLADFKVHRVGLMGYYVNTIFKVHWTKDPFKIISGLETVNAGGGSESSEANALKDALNEMQIAKGRGVVVLVGAEYCVKAERTDCAEQNDAEAAARALTAAGYRVVVANSQQDAGLLASSDLDVVSFGGNSLGGAVPVYQRMTSFLHPDSLLKTFTVTDVLPANIDLVPGSLKPDAAWDAASRTLSWQLTNAAYDGTVLSYRVQPQAAGRWPTNVEASADFVDGWDGTGRVTFPVPEIDVIQAVPPTPTQVPTPVPTETPSASATPLPTATPMPTATPLPQPIYLPYLVVNRCVPTRLPMELAVVVDISSSMNEPTMPGGPTKLAAAVDAARALVQSGLADGDQVAVVSFDAEAHVAQRLTADKALASAALDRLTAGAGTNLAGALAVAGEVLAPLAGAGQGAAAAPALSRALILLTDGRPSVPSDPAEAHSLTLGAAAELHARGVIVYTVGLGTDVDAALLTQVAGSPTRYYGAPQAADLARIYASLPVVVPCGG